MKRILLITATPIRSDTNMGKTAHALFKSFDKESIYQLYFSPEAPNCEFCNEYYQVCEKQLIKSFFGLHKSPGGVKKPVFTGKDAAKPQKNPAFLKRAHENTIVKIGREMVWDVSHWKTRVLKKWLDDVNPDIIFSIMHDTNAAAKAIKWISNYTSAPIVLYITDDYYNNQYNNANLLRFFYYKHRQQLYKKLGKNLKYIIGCSEITTEYFKKQLNIKNGTTIFVPSSDEYRRMESPIQSNDKIIKIRYFGNVGLGRWQILKQLGEAIARINKNEKKAILEIYSVTTDQETINQLNVPNGAKFMGFVTGDDYLRLLESTEIAVHVESFDAADIKRTWASVSTKIADYLGAGKCILAIGDPKLASIDHIKDVAHIISDLGQLDNKLLELLEDYTLRERLQDKARKCALKYHAPTIIDEQMHKIIDGIN